MGVQFLYESHAQQLLIDKFIQEALRGQSNARQLPRTSCHMDDVHVERKDLEVISLENISTEGLLLNYRGSLSKGDSLALSVGIPGNARRCSSSGTVVPLRRTHMKRPSLRAEVLTVEKERRE